MKAQKTQIWISGYKGALGTHCWLRALELGFTPKRIELRTHNIPETAPEPVHVLHLAGINRGTDEETEFGNLRLAQDLTNLLERSNATLETLSYSNSVQAFKSSSSYSRGKEAAARHLENWCKLHGVRFRNLMLPNLAGEFGKPNANMVTTTLVHLAIEGQNPDFLNEDVFSLSTLQEAADTMLDFELNDTELRTFAVSAKQIFESAVSAVAQMDRGVQQTSNEGLDAIIWRMVVFGRFESAHPTRELSPSVDARGSFTELYKASGGSAQFSIVRLAANAMRGNHFHRYLVEDFYLSDGSVQVDYGKAWESESEHHSIELSPGECIRFPIGWWHRFTDLTGDASTMLVSAQRLFDPANPDTIYWPEIETETP